MKKLNEQTCPLNSSFLSIHKYHVSYKIRYLENQIHTMRYDRTWIDLFTLRKCSDLFTSQFALKRSHSLSVTLTNI